MILRRTVVVDRICGSTVNVMALLARVLSKGGWRCEERINARDGTTFVMVRGALLSHVSASEQGAPQGTGSDT